MDKRETLHKIKQMVLEEIDLSQVVEDERLHRILDKQILLAGKKYSLSLMEQKEYARQIFNSLRRLGVLQELIDDDSVTEIMVNGPGCIFYERSGELNEWKKAFASDEELEDVIQQIAGMGNRMVNASSPIVDTRLLDGSRVNMVLCPVSVDAPVITIRKFPKKPMQMEELELYGSVCGEITSFLKKLVKAGYNIFVSGGTGSGKTTFLNALSAYIPKNERVITIEDSAELQLHGLKNLVRMETRNATMESVTAVTIRDLIKTSLRMRPDRIIVGECRGAEAIDFLQAINTGHKGSLGTGHANSSYDMIKRLETMVLMGMDIPVPAIRSQIASGIDILIHLGRLRDRSRKLLEIAETDGMKGGEIQLNPIYKFRETGEKDGKIKGEWERVGKIRHTGKLLEAGLE